jgi:hypothetical protein
MNFHGRPLVKGQATPIPMLRLKLYYPQRQGVNETYNFGKASRKARSFKA